MNNFIALFYNPVAGAGNFAGNLDYVVRLIQAQGFTVTLFRLERDAPLDDWFRVIDFSSYHTLIACGGDGTVHLLANAMMRYGVRTPLLIFPEGTSNDLAKYLGISSTTEAYVELLTRGQLLPIDLGKIGERYFINVAAGGAITETVHEVDYTLKNSFGRLAYYLKGVGKLPQLQKLHLRLAVDGESFEEDIWFFMLLNGGVSGGFRHLNFADALGDGKLDFVALRPQSLQKTLHILLQLPSGNPLTDAPGIFYRQGKNFSIELDRETESDLDGENGPVLPWQVEVIPSALTLRVPKEEDREIRENFFSLPSFTI
jgi:YegS/Rv2252/BmrU family lipid kinase